MIVIETTQWPNHPSRGGIEPIAFYELSYPFKEKIRERESYLKATRLWEFVIYLEIPWPWPANLSDFVISACASEFQQLYVRKQLVR